MAKHVDHKKTKRQRALKPIKAAARLKRQLVAQETKEQRDTRRSREELKGANP